MEKSKCSSEDACCFECCHCCRLVKIAAPGDGCPIISTPGTDPHNGLEFCQAHEAHCCDIVLIT